MGVIVFTSLRYDVLENGACVVTTKIERSSSLAAPLRPSASIISISVSALVCLDRRIDPPAPASVALNTSWQRNALKRVVSANNRQIVGIVAGSVVMRYRY